jgi:diphosphomevalonate decarboxylase
MAMLIGAARAHPNIALVKYWGKRDVGLNLPAAGSLSITLDELVTETTVRFDPELEQDQLILNGRCDAARAARVSASLDLLRAMAGVDWRARVCSDNNFPTAAGLASSASGFAALVLAAGQALGLTLSERQLSVLARRGSGSAARSIYGGYVEMLAGSEADGSDAFAKPLHEASHWPLNAVVAITTEDAKQHGSTDGMEHSRRTSPFFGAFIDQTDADLELARDAVAARDFEALATVAEHSCLKMHSVMLSSNPGLVYWNPVTLSAIHRVRELRASGVAVFFTIDAGPQLKAICLPEVVSTVSSALSEIGGVQRVISVGLGGPAGLMEAKL